MSMTNFASSAAKHSQLRPQRIRAIGLVSLMILASLSAFEFGSWEAMATNDQDGDGLTYGLEFLLNTQPQDWDSDNDGLPDGWEYQYGLDPLDSSNLGNDGAAGDPDGDGLTNLQEYSYLEPSSWDLPGTSNTLDNGVWWNGTVPVRNWDEESAMQAQPGQGGDGADEDPMGDMCNDGIDNDYDGLVDAADSDGDGDALCGSDDDDGDGLIDEDPDGWDTDNDGMSDGWEVANGLNATNPSNADGMNGDPDGDGLLNIYEYMNPSWDTSSGGIDYFQPGPAGSGRTETISPCNPVLGIGPNGCQTMTAEVDGVFSTNPQIADTDGDGLNDSYEALTLLTDPTDIDTDSDGIDDGVEVNGLYGNPAQASDPRDNNTDDDQLDDGDEDKNGNGQIDANETDPTRREDAGDFDNDGIENWEENLTCTLWNVYDSDFGGIGDGDERNWSHGTDPCDSMIDFSSTLPANPYNPSLQRLTLTDGSGFRTSSGTGYYNDSLGQHTSFAYSSRSGNILFGVALAPPAGTTDVVSKNGSWCHYDAVMAGTISSTQRYCDDDYEDTDGDGLADWEELLGTYGFTSLPTDVDSDGDLVSDYDEVMNGTDPMEPCDNNRDTDGDMLNDYFENNTGCPIDFIPGIIGNGSVDVYVTDYLNPDTDSGGVWDGQEYLDGTNPQNDPGDDQHPSDFDGDGIPDSVENNTGTDWRDPDTDGGGMLDGEECPPPMWMFNCIGGSYNPWDPTDDVIQNEIYFFANNTTMGVDTNLERFWRVHTYDQYTGASYGKNSTFLEPAFWTLMSQGFTDDQWIANSTFINSTETWIMDFTNPVMNTNIAHPSATTGFVAWADPAANVSHGNISHDILVEDSGVFSMFLDAPEIWFDASELSNSIPYVGVTNYALDVPSTFTDSAHPHSEVRNITFAVINEAGAVSAWDKAVALQEYLRNGNATTDFLLNHDGSALPLEEDLTNHLIVAAKEGRCTEFATAYTTMARIAGLPTRKVSGFQGGFWHGAGYSVSGFNSATWSEVHLQQNAAGNNFDMGWIPLDVCPVAADVEVINEEWAPLTASRDHTTGDMWLNGTLQFTENLTVVNNHTVTFYLVPPAEAASNPSGAALSERTVGTGMTDWNGTFNLRGIPAEILQPGFGTFILEVSQAGYVSHGYETFSWTINITENLNITQSSPAIPGEPIVGAGTTTLVTGNVRWENVPFDDPSLVGPLTLFMNYTSSIDGVVSMQTTVGTDGYYEFNVTLNENEGLGLLPATIEFPGWHESGLHLQVPPSYHVWPGTYNLNLNISAAPNLTAVLEGPGTNNSLLSVGEDLFINGTVLSRGLNPQPMTGILYLQMRQNGTNGPMENITFWTINASSWSTSPGNFSLTWNFASGYAQTLDPGYIDAELMFVPDLLEANDIANLSGGYGLQTNLTIEYSIGPIQRGQMTSVNIGLIDHRGNYVLPANGTYISTFDGQVVSTNTSVDVEFGSMSIDWTPSANTPVGDYLWFTNYTSSTQWYKNATSMGDVRMMGQIVISTALGSDWVHIGNSSYITGDIRDDVTNAVIVGNQTTLIFEFELPGVGPTDPMGNPPPPFIIPIGSAVVNSTTGQYNLSFTMPINFPGGIYDITIAADFAAGAPIGGAYYALDEPASTRVGCESESQLLLNQSSVVVQVNQNLIIEVDVKDVATFYSTPPPGLEDSQNMSGAQVEFFWDALGVNSSLGTVTADSNGRATLSWTVPQQQDPGYYDVWIVMYDDVTDSLSNNNGARWKGNQTLANVTVQVPTVVDINASVPSTVTAAANFQISGTIEDSVNSSRQFDGPVDIEIFWLDDAEEMMAAGHTTAINGSFNLTVNSDPNGDGIVSGNHTLVISVIEGSNPFYLTATGTKQILVMGVTDFEGLYPLSGVVVTRGNSIDFGGRLIESTDIQENGAPRMINFTSVGAEFHETWLPENTTDINGSVGFTYSVPMSQPLGPITITLYYNGTWHMHPDASPINTVTIRSITILVVDNITDNPISGGGFNVTGTLVSDNGSAIISRDGTPMLPTLTFDIDGFSNTFVVANGTAQGNGTWWAFVTLDADFPRGTHTITADYTPSVNFYGESTGNNTFDSRGYSVLDITSPLDLNLDDRVIRGNSFTVSIVLVDNAGSPIANESVFIESISMGDSFWITTDASGIGSGIFNVSNSTTPGPHWLNASYGGLAGTTGVLGDTFQTRVVVLAPTNLTIESIEGTLIAGESLLINGTLLDEHGNPLVGTDGNATGGVIHLILDGSDVGPVWATLSDGPTGAYSIIYTLPQGITAGPHNISVEFYGGYLWVDPVGSGDSVNPEYYLPASLNSTFNATQPTHIDITSGGGQIDREQLISISGVLLDSVDRPVADMTISVYLDGVFLTNVTSGNDGTFDVFYPVPADMTLGLVTMDVEFDGAEFHLSSNAQVNWEVYSSVNVAILPADAAAIGDTIELSGTVRDNLPEGWVSGHQVDIRIDGMLIGNATTDENGVWRLNWTIPTTTDLGNHSIEVYAPAQGWYRDGVANGTIWIAHHSSISLSASNGGDATRGMSWVMTGRLYDTDEVGLPGIPGATVHIALDGATFTSIITDSNGSFTVIIPVDMSSTRGDHLVTARYDGDTSWLGSERDSTVTTWANVDLEITYIRDNAIRGDSEHPIHIEGRIVEIGGSGNSLSDLVLSLSVDNSTISSPSITWDNQTGSFVIEFVADRYMTPGEIHFILNSEADESRHLNAANSTVDVFLRVRVVFDVGTDDSREIAWGSYSLTGTVTARDFYSSQAVPGLSIEVHLRNDSAENQLDYYRAGDTDEFGVWTFQFEYPDSVPPLSDTDHWGWLHLWFNSTAPELDEESRSDLSRPMYPLTYEPESKATEGMSAWVYGVTALVVVAIGAGAWILYMRRKDAIDELAEIFSYTAELLAAGDAIREAIFNCYEDLCGVLMAQGFLRRDFETVREFEMAIRKAMPISEEALTALDNMFEIARYSRHELDDSHRQQAADALQRTTQEIYNLAEIPGR
ncbi:MAG: transglutaminase domain-containing protein [Candidatus Thalassarchaeaceae archaeon]|nr:transglutaminase domain-containing protein [Candidatus Thalassarchaeaceae archaeon]